jgi:hypothetical protein
VIRFPVFVARGLGGCCILGNDFHLKFETVIDYGMKLVRLRNSSGRVVRAPFLRNDEEPDLEMEPEIIRNTPGHPTTLKQEDEVVIIDSLLLLSEWGFPQSVLELRLIVKSYLDARGLTVEHFKDNLPGRDWALGFLKRHKRIVSQRVCQNIKQKRAKTTREDILEYFSNLKEQVSNIPASHILNYDETNFTNHPKSKKLIFKTKTKRPERILNSTKTSFSVMFTITSDGLCLPPYVVYKAEALWNKWTEGGPKGCRYNRTASGWFDAATFKDWFTTVMVPWAKKLSGLKVVIGNNLSSHFSVDVLNKCFYMISSLFVCLPILHI